MPEAEELIARIKEALDIVAQRDREMPLPMRGDWFPAIAREIAARVEAHGVECCARGLPVPGHLGWHSEWLFDFCALFYEEGPDQHRFLAQLLIVGEIEWDFNVIDDDFEKLLVVDSLVCFLTFAHPERAGAQKKFNELRPYIVRRQNYIQRRGIEHPPIFLLSCWINADEGFIHEVI